MNYYKVDIFNLVKDLLSPNFNFLVDVMHKFLLGGFDTVFNNIFSLVLEKKSILQQTGQVFIIEKKLNSLLDESLERFVIVHDSEEFYYDEDGGFQYNASENYPFDVLYNVYDERIPLGVDFRIIAPSLGGSFAYNVSELVVATSFLYNLGESEIFYDFDNENDVLAFQISEIVDSCRIAGKRYDIAFV